MKPVALDLFCGAGGASMGIHRAGFEVVGVDINPQPRYPFEFHQADALSFPIAGVSFVWASPPCQRHSRMSGCRAGLREQYPDLIGPIRERLKAWGGPYIIENVVGAPLENPLLLCGAMFGLKTYRHRIFESNFTLLSRHHEKHSVPASSAGHWRLGTYISVAGNFHPMPVAKEAMGIDWMRRAELAESIPPAYSEFLCRQVIAQITPHFDKSNA